VKYEEEEEEEEGGKKNWRVSLSIGVTTTMIR